MKTNEELKNTPNLLIIRTSNDGGMGEMFIGGKRFGSVIWSNGCGWEHVSVAPYKRRYTPSWDDMCTLKNMFFRDDEVAVQYHPAKNEYVNNMPNCLHLWRPINVSLPVPPSIMVGIKKGQTEVEILEAISELDTQNCVFAGTTKNICVVCGENIPEGREICYQCELKEAKRNE